MLSGILLRTRVTFRNASNFPQITSAFVFYMGGTGRGGVGPPRRPSLSPYLFRILRDSLRFFKILRDFLGFVMVWRNEGFMDGPASPFRHNFGVLDFERKS